MKQNSFYQALQKAIETEEDFVLYRMPKEEEVCFLAANSHPIADHYFTFCSFDQRIQVKWQADATQRISTKEWDTDAFAGLQLPKKEDHSVLSAEAYRTLALDFIAQMQGHRFQKIILSRTKEQAPFASVGEQLKLLFSRYPSAFVYLLRYKGELWLGATPETLLQQTENTVTSVALAGTQAVENNFEKKEREEQAYVTAYLKDKFPPKQTISPTYEIELGALKHLKTDISAEVPEGFDFDAMANDLHPTPAVCGIPKKETLAYIVDKEPHNRKLYTGYLGIYSPTKKHYFVNLRCAQLFEDGTLLYLGGGLTKDSSPEKEWLETELKAKALR